MLNYETLLSSYDDKLTLLQWLKKVEAALKDASAVDFKVNKKGDATLTFSIVFDDGSELESGEIVLQQGESVASAAIVNGHLILTLTNGDELDAGQLLNGDLNVSGNLSATGNALIGGYIHAEQPETLQEITTFYKDSAGTTEWENIERYFTKIQINAHVIDLVLYMAFVADGSNEYVFRFSIPTSIGSKFATAWGNVIEVKNMLLVGLNGSSMGAYENVRAYLHKAWDGALFLVLSNVPASLSNYEKVAFRYYFEGIE